MSLGDFWFFGMAKGKMKDREFHTLQDIFGLLAQIWNDLTFESLFIESQICLNSATENGGEYDSEYGKRMEIYLTHISKAFYRQDFLDTL
jgi:hypothetical protein